MPPGRQGSAFTLMTLPSREDQQSNVTIEIPLRLRRPPSGGWKRVRRPLRRAFGSSRGGLVGVGVIAGRRRSCCADAVADRARWSPWPATPPEPAGALALRSARRDRGPAAPPALLARDDGLEGQRDLLLKADCSRSRRRPCTAAGSTGCPPAPRAARAKATLALASGGPRRSSCRARRRRGGAIDAQ
jgi:hypothetical protein